VLNRRLKAFISNYLVAKIERFINQFNRPLNMPYEKYMQKCIEQGACKIEITGNNTYLLTFVDKEGNPILDALNVTIPLIKSYMKRAVNLGLAVDFGKIKDPTDYEQLNSFKMMLEEVNKIPKLDVQQTSKLESKIDLDNVDKIIVNEYKHHGEISYVLSFYIKNELHRTLSMASQEFIFLIAKNNLGKFKIGQVSDRYVKGNLENILNGKPMSSLNFPKGIIYSRKNLEAKNGK
jgi:hypothetical protein